MAVRIQKRFEGEDFQAAVRAYRQARQPAALTGAGISVECGIPDFRSPGGLWSVYDPEEYASLQAFLWNPDKAWGFYRALAETLAGRSPGAAHAALARLEQEGGLRGVVTQNIDGLHARAGSRTVLEVHGEHRNLVCLQCGNLEPARPQHLRPGPAPRCRCGFPLKPNVVLFGEAVRRDQQVDELLQGCDLLLVIGTSAEVFPVADFPRRVQSQGGRLLEFNLGPTPLTRACDFLFVGRAGETVPAFVDAVLK